MGRSLANDIAEYINRMRKIRESILALEGEELIDNHKKTLLFSLLETMSKGVYGDKFSRNGERFESFILEFCDWENAERISLQQMALVLEKAGETDLIELKAYTFNELSKYPSSRPVPFSIDPFVEEVQHFISTEKLFGKIKPVDLKHVNLLWRYRNTLVHEARSIGADRLFDFEEEPHYIHYYQLGRDDEGEILTEGSWQIYYPLKFFINIVDTAISNIGPYLIENEKNPFENYEFEPLWIKVR